MNKSYWLHCLAPDAPAAVHLRTLGRSEVLIFGDVKFNGSVPPMGIGTEFTLSIRAGQKPKLTQVCKGLTDAEVQEFECKDAKLSSVLEVLAASRRRVRRSDRTDPQGRPRPDMLSGLGAGTGRDPGAEMNIQQLAGFSKIDSTLAKAGLRSGPRQRRATRDMDANGFDLPTGKEAQVRPAGPVVKAKPLNRDPGHLLGPLFGPKLATPMRPFSIPGRRTRRGTVTENPADRRGMAAKKATKENQEQKKRI